MYYVSPILKYFEVHSQNHDFMLFVSTNYFSKVDFLAYISDLNIPFSPNSTHCAPEILCIYSLIDESKVICELSTKRTNMLGTPTNGCGRFIAARTCAIDLRHKSTCSGLMKASI
jgi:hypothetical protein